jgi:hypothetical protein
VTTTISMTTLRRLCQRKIVLVSGMTPPGTLPPASTMARVAGWMAEGVAIWRAAEPERP